MTVASYARPAVRLLAVLLLVAAGGLLRPLEAAPARPAPPLPAPAGPIVNVSTEAQLQAAVRGLTSNTTIVIAPGTYVLTSTLYVKGVTNVGIRGATNNPDDVVLVGRGMAEANYGSVPFGIWTGNGVNGITIANLTIRDLYFHPIIFNAGTESPRVYNVHLMNAGEQLIKSNPDNNGGGVDNGVVEYSVIEFVTAAKSDYTKGIDVQTAKNWIIRNNLFRNIVAPPGQIAGPGVLAWRGTSNTLVEGNTFINCARGVMFGSDDYYSPSHSGGIIRNNIFFRSASQPGDVGIILSDSPGTQVINNTLYVSGTYGSPIEYRYAGTRNVLIANNLLDGIIKSRDGATATLSRNYTGAGPGMFVNAASGDLHLSALAVPAIDQGATTSAVTDWDGQPRPQGAGYDIGADERGASTASYRIAGRVTDGEGAGLSGVTIALSGGQSRTTTTDANGTYSLTSLASGATYTVTPSKAGYSFTPPNQYYAALGQDDLTADFVATADAPPGGGATASFLRTDTSTQGNWTTAYGSDGYLMAGVTAALPGYAKVSITGATSCTWAATSTDPRGLQRPGAGDRLAACWYAAGSFTVDIDLVDGATHQAAFYGVDWDRRGRSQRVEVLDASTGAVLDARTMTAFQNGQYLVWTLSGHVKLRFVNTGPNNTVLSGIFFGGSGAVVPPPPGASASAAFVRNDAATKGSWTSAYGRQGFGIAGVATSYPAYARVSISGASSCTWAATTTDVRALQRPGAADRLATCWYAATRFVVDVNLTDGAAHKLAVYSVDWDSRGRSQRVEVLDAATGTVLDTRSISGFQGGQYLVWRLSGHVQLRFVNTGPNNAVVSGIFFDADASGSTATFVRADTTTKGSWRGVYGKAGYALAGVPLSLPSYAGLAVKSATSCTWASTTTDVRALQRPNATDRLAACWYSSSSFTTELTLTDGAAHQVALYSVDWDNRARTQRVDVLDARSGAVLDTRTVSAFGGGQYLVWNVSGPVVFRVTRTAGPNGVVSGWFFD